MEEFIITGEQFEKAMEAIDNELRRWSIDRPVTEVFVSGEELPRLVRCRDCAWYEAREYRRHCDRTGSFQIEPDGFCSWGERK